MSNIITNFFELFIEPDIQTLFVTERFNVNKTASPAGLSTYLDKNSIISLQPIAGSKTIPSKPQYIEWLIKKLLFEKLESEDLSFDPDYRGGEVTILKETPMRI